MRILHVEKFIDGPVWSAGGVGAYVRALASHQRAAGHETARFGCTDDPRRNPQRPAFVDFTSAGPGALPRMIHNPEAATKLAAFLHRAGPFDLAHLHNVYHHLTPSILPVLRRHGCAVVMTAHDYRLACPAKHFLRDDGLCTRCTPHRLHHALSRRCMGLRGAAPAVETLLQRLARRYVRGVDLLICPTAYMRHIQVRCGWPAGKAVVAHNPVAPPGGANRPDGGGPALDVLFCGRLSPEKGPGLMLDLAARLPDASVALAGDGPARGELETRARREGLGNVHFCGRIEPEAVGGLLARARLFALTSRCMENSPAALLEAMWAGVCVLAPDHPPIREWVRDGRTGRTFDPAEPDSLAAAATGLLADPARRAALAAAGQERVRRLHDPRIVLARFDELYEEARRRCALR